MILYYESLSREEAIIALFPGQLKNGCTENSCLICPLLIASMSKLVASYDGVGWRSLLNLVLRLSTQRHLL